MSRIESLEARQMMTVTVNTLADVVDPNDAYMSLREALLESDPVVAFHTSLSGGRIVLNQGQLSVNKAITITGPGADNMTIDAGGLSRVISVGAGVNATISGVTITGGYSSEGGGVLNFGDLTLNSVVVAGNTSTNLGGGVSSRNGATGFASLHVLGSTIDGNFAVGGAGIFATPALNGVVEIIGSTISNNRGVNLESSAHSAGGGIYFNGAATGSVLIANSTISGNAALHNGGVRLHNNLAPTTIVNSTIAYNTGNDSGGLHRLSSSSPITIHNTIIAENKDHSGADSDLAGAVVLGSSHNLIGRGSMGVLSNNDAYHNIVLANGQYAELSPLANHGGSTKTHVPLPSSRAIDAGGTISQPALSVDQRGFARGAERPQTNVASARDIGAVELSSTVGPTGDFNGDGRDDQLLFDPTTKSIQVAVGAAVVGNYGVEAWGVMPSEVLASSTFVVGDFNGDGRDDLLIKSGSVYRLAISDGSTFLTRQAILPNWGSIYTGDFDGDGSDEILGVTGSGAASSWSVAKYSDAFGLSAATAVSTLAGFVLDSQHFFQDANRDGRKDIIARANSSSPWMVRLAGANADGSLKFETTANWNAWIGYGYDNTLGKLNADKAMAKVIEEFAWVYNNVELELYPGLMKGPEATRQTKAGNNWDQAALLEKRLQDIGVGDVKIATGKVRVAAEQFDNLANWLGVLSTTSPSTRAVAIFNVLQRSLDANAVALDANGNSTTNAALVAAIEFTHAWVQAYVPTQVGLAWVNLDPSWKFKDRQDGIALASTLELDTVHTSLGTGIFDEYSYLALDAANDRRLPLEFFEDQLMSWLSSSPIHQGSSLADIAHDGPILAKSFATLPTGFMDGMALAANPGIATYNDFATIANHATLKNELTHRVRIRLLKGTVEHWFEDLVVPVHSLDAIHVTFASSFATVNDPTKIAPIGSTAFFGRLVVGGILKEAAQSGEWFGVNDNAIIELVHFAPTRMTEATSLLTTDPLYVGPSAYDTKARFTETPGDIISIGLEANQHSHQSLAALQASLLAATAGDTTEAQLLEDVALLGSYAIAKYWYDYQRQNDAIAGLMGAVSQQSWVGSGRIKARPNLLEDPTGPVGDVIIDYLAFGMAPEGFGIDLPNTNNGALSIVTGAFHAEAWQLIGYNSSAMEHNIVEELTSADSVSTIKGLQKAYRKNQGLNSSGNAVSDDVIRVFDSRVTGSTRTVYHVYNIRAGGVDVEVIGTVGVGTAVSETAFKNLLASHANATQIDDTLWDFLSNKKVNNVGPLDGVTDNVKSLATRHRTKVDSWIGAVYLTEVPGRSLLFAIRPDGGTSTNGGYSGGVTTPPPPELKLGNFLNSTWAGDPVSVANGNMFRDEVDFTFPNLGTPLSFARHYDSQSKDDVGLGAGWTFTFGDVLYTESGAPNDLVWLDARGARHTFKWNGSNGFNIPNDLQGTLRYINPSTGSVEQTTTSIAGTNQWTEIRFKSVDGAEFHFQRIANYQPFGQGGTWVARLRMQLDANGDGVKVTLNSQFPYHQTIEDIHDSSRRLTWTTIIGGDGNVAFNDIALYNGTSQPVATWRFDMQVLPAAQSSAFSPYRLEKVIGNYSPAALPDDLRITSYSYHPSSLPSKGLMQRITEPDGAWHEYEYFRNSRVFRVKQGEAGQLPSAAAVDVQTFNYNLLKMQTEFTDERGNVETYLHQKNGLLTKQIHDDRSRVESSWGVINTAEEFLMTSTTDERGAIENFTYYGISDPAFKRGQLKESTAKHYPNQAGLLTRYDYVQPNSGKPHLVSPSTVVVDPNSAIADPASGYYIGQKLTTTHTYHPSGDSLGKLWKTTDARGNVVEYSYYSNSETVYRRGLLKSIKQPAILDPNDPNNVATVAYETVFDYDAAGNITKSTRQTVPIAPAPPVIIAESTFAYDSMGNVVRSVDPTGVVTESIIDALGRLLETGYGDSNVNVNPLDAFTSRFKYDAVGRVRESADPLGRVATYEYDRQGNVVKQINPDGTAILHAYDSFGLRVATTDPLGRITQFVYDSRNRMIQTIHPDGGVERLRYDGLGNVVASIDALGNVTTFKYDAASRLIEAKLPDPDGPNNDDGGANLTEPTTTNKYDKLGNLVETIDPEFNVTQFKYDKLGRVIESRTIDGREFVNKTLPQKTAIRNAATPYVPVLGHNPVTLQTTDYDAVGNVARTTVYDISQISSIPTDPRDLITPANIAANKVQVASMRYDAFGRPVKVINADNSFTTTQYDAAGRVRYQRDELSRVTEFRYDAFGRLDKTLLPDPSTGAITTASPTTTYRYDAAGNRIAAVDPRGFTTQFEYDAFNRLAATVDAQGARTRSIYDVAGQLVATVDALGRAAYTLYDDRGRAIQQRGADPDGAGPGVAPVTRHRYDAAGRVIETIDQLGYSTQYRYDRLGRLVKETFTTGYEVIDAGNPGFVVHAGTAAAVNQPSDYGGDSLLVSPATSPSNPVMIWTFNNLQPGSYRVLAHWSGHQNATAWLVYRLSDYYDETTGVSGGYWPGDFIDQGVSQRVASSGMMRYENGSWAGWKELHAGFEIDDLGPGSIGVHFAATNQAIQADAIRIERLASRSYEYDANGNLLKETDPLGRHTIYAYDELDRLVVETLPDPDGDGPLLLSPQTTTTYDGYGNVKSVLERRGTGAHLRKTTYQYDARNRRTEQIVDADNGNVNVTYLNQKTTFLYDDVGNLTEKIELPGHPTLERKTSYFYDQLNRLSIQTNNDVGTFIATSVNERMEIYYYDAAGNLTQTLVNPLIDQRQIATLNRYDAVGRLVEQTEQGLVGGGTEKRTTRFQYDAVGNQTAVIDPLHRMSRSEYDRLGRLVKSIDPDPDGAGPLAPVATTFVYDAAGNLVSETNGANETQSFAYDPQGRLVRSVDGRGDVTTRRYDAAGNLSKLTDPAGNATTYVYDGLDRVTAEATTAGTRHFIYDTNGNLFYTVDRNGRASRFAYDRLDRVGSERGYANLNEAQTTASAWSQMFVTSYDELGRLARDQSFENNAAAQTVYRATDSYRYDGLDRVVEHSNQDLLEPGGPHSTGPAWHQTYVYAYEASGLTVTREQFLAGQFAAQTKSTYNAFGELTRIQDADVGAGGASAILDFAGREASFAYDASGALTETVRHFDFLSGAYQNSVRTAYAYDGAGRLASLSHLYRSSPSVVYNDLASFAYGYDDASRINRIATTWNTGLHGLANRWWIETADLTYDKAGQLVLAEWNNETHDAAYGYNANGNRSAAGEPVGGVDSYVTGSQNRVSQDSTYSYEYDAEGNLTERRLTSGNVLDQRFAWDHRNRLVKVENFGASGLLTETVAYRYNAGDDLIYRSVTPAGQAAQVEHYVVAGGERTIAYEADGDVKRRYQYGPTGEVLFDQVFDHTVTTLLQAEQDLLVPLGDHQHSTRLVVGSDEFDGFEIRQSIDYAPFGRVTAIRDEVGSLVQNGAGQPDLSALDSVFTHHGSLLDAATGLQLKGQRWYSPDLGRFVSEDPIQDGSNWYLFAGNDPVNHADPSGLSQQGHPLAGGYSGGKTTAPAIKNGNLFGGFVNADRGRQILGLPAISTPVAAPRQPTVGEQFNRNLTSSSNLAALTRQTAPSYGLQPSQTGASLRAYQEEQALSALRRANEAELVSIAQLQTRRGKSVTQEATDVANVGSGLTPFVSDVRDVYEVTTGKDAFTGQRLSGFNRGLTVVAAALPVVGGSTLRKIFGAGDAVGAAEQSRNALGQFLAKNSGEVAPGAARQQRVQEKLVGKFGSGAVQPEQYLRTADGRIAIDPVTGEARRVDFAVIRNGQAVGTVEVTSKTARKGSQVAKEESIRQNGGTYIQDRTTGQLIDFSNAPQRTSRRR